MNLSAAGVLATAFTFVVAVVAVLMYFVPWARIRPAAALTALLWLQVPRYVALQIFSAREFGFHIPLSMAREIAWGDVAGAVLAFLAILALRYRRRVAWVALWALVIETLIDLVNATIQGIQNRAYDTAHAVTWIILTFYTPVLWVSLVGIIWLLVVRGDELHTGTRAATDAAARAIRSKE